MAAAVKEALGSKMAKRMERRRKRRPQCSPWAAVTSIDRVEAGTGLDSGPHTPRGSKPGSSHTVAAAPKNTL